MVMRLARWSGPTSLPRIRCCSVNAVSRWISLPDCTSGNWCCSERVHFTTSGGNTSRKHSIKKVDLMIVIESRWRKGGFGGRSAQKRSAGTTGGWRRKRSLPRDLQLTCTGRMSLSCVVDASSTPSEDDLVVKRGHSVAVEARGIPGDARTEGPPAVLRPERK